MLEPTLAKSEPPQPKGEQEKGTSSKATMNNLSTMLQLFCDMKHVSSLEGHQTEAITIHWGGSGPANQKQTLELLQLVCSGVTEEERGPLLLQSHGMWRLQATTSPVNHVGTLVLHDISHLRVISALHSMGYVLNPIHNMKVEYPAKQGTGVFRYALIYYLLKQ